MAKKQPRAELTLAQTDQAPEILREAKETAMAVLKLDVEIDRAAKHLKGLKENREALVRQTLGTVIEGRQLELDEAMAGDRS